MSYCRWGPDSDIYIYEDAALDGITCCDCEIVGGTYNTPTATDMLAHLGLHVTYGHRVPPDVITQLEAET